MFRLLCFAIIRLFLPFLIDAYMCKPVSCKHVFVVLIITPLQKQVVLDVLYNPILIMKNTTGMTECKFLLYLEHQYS
jgi:hypothetical protein